MLAFFREQQNPPPYKLPRLMLGKLLEEAQKGGGEGEGGSGSPKRPKSPKSPKSPKKGRKESKKKNEDSGGKSPGPSE